MPPPMDHLGYAVNGFTIGLNFVILLDECILSDDKCERYDKGYRIVPNGSCPCLLALSCHYDVKAYDLSCTSLDRLC
ncbi:Uncharacterized protein TCM_044136 [Theobroma cacao]|uniref:Uncharacterized protein n=1 Tax=Theobroma cacao TaxID=3641 RepID=A0A061FPJ3_THECC|nr:Uncharacterized protein TCM_044136 [Theobroma cacao]